MLRRHSDCGGKKHVSPSLLFCQRPRVESFTHTHDDDDDESDKHNSSNNRESSKIKLVKETGITRQDPKCLSLLTNLLVFASLT